MLLITPNVLEGIVIGRGMNRHCHDEFLRFLNTIETAVRAGKLIHVIIATMPLTNTQIFMISRFGIRAEYSILLQPRPYG
jgi:hypothetical protein